MTAGVEISRRILLINSASTTLRRLLSLSVLFWLQQYLLHRIEATEYELYPVLISLMLFFELGTPIFASGLRRFATEAWARGDEVRVTRLVSTMAPVLLAVASVLLAIGLLVAWEIDGVLDIAPDRVGEARLMFALLVSGAALQLAAVPFGIGFHMRQKFLAKSLIGLGAELLRVTLLLVLLTAVSTRVLWVVVALVTSNTCELMAVTTLSMRLVPTLRLRPNQFRRELLRPLLGFGTWSFLGRIAYLIREAADNLILNKLAAPIQVNCFYVGSLADTSFRRIFLETMSTAQPMVTAMHATGQQDRLRSTYFRLSRYSLWVLLAVSVPLIVYRHEFFQLYLREEYAAHVAAATVMALLLARAVIIFPNSILGMVAVAKAQLRQLVLIAIGMSAANLALTLYLVGVRGMGAIGSALGTFAITVVGAPLFIWTLGLRLTGARLRPWLRASVWPGLQPALIAAPVWLLLRQIAPPTGWWALILECAAGETAYLAALLAFCLRPADRDDLHELIARARTLLGHALPER